MNSISGDLLAKIWSLPKNTGKRQDLMTFGLAIRQIGVATSQVTTNVTRQRCFTGKRKNPIHFRSSIRENIDAMKKHGKT